MDPAVAPGAKSLYDDFVAIHLMQTMNIHLSVCFPQRAFQVVARCYSLTAWPEGNLPDVAPVLYLDV